MDFQYANLEAAWDIEGTLRQDRHMDRRNHEVVDFSGIDTAAELGEALRRLRDQRRPTWSNARAASAAGVRLTTISNWFKGQLPRDREKLRDYLMAVGAQSGEISQLMRRFDRLAEIRRLDGRRTQGETTRTDPHWTVVTPPYGQLPEVRGRQELFDALGQRDRSDRNAVFDVLTGMGGAGKTTVALALARQREELQIPVWWVTASDASRLAAGMLTIAARLGATESDLSRAHSSHAYAIELCWSLLNGQETRWMLCVDNADDPDVLAPGDASLSGGTGWIRASSSGEVLVTSRLGSAAGWGSDCRLWPVPVLRPDDGADVILDRIGTARRRSAGSSTVDDARSISELLGGVPLALHLAGSYLGSSLTGLDLRGYLAELRTPTAGSGTAVDVVDLGAGLDPNDDNARRRIASTWELSLQHLDSEGTPQARRILRLLAHLASNEPVPVALLDPALLAEHGIIHDTPNAAGAVVAGLSALHRVGLVDAPGKGDSAVVVVHPLVGQSARLSSAGADSPRADRSLDAAVAVLEREADRLDAADWGNIQKWPQWIALAAHAHAVLTHAAGADLSLVERTVRLAVAVSEGMLEGVDHAVTEALFRLAIDTGRRLGDEHPATLTARGDLGTLLLLRGNYAEAERVIRAVLAIRIRVNEPTDPELYSSRQSLAVALGQQDEFAEAEQLLRQTLNDQRRTLGPDHNDTITTQNNLGWILLKAGKNTDAELEMREALAARQRTLGPEHFFTLTARHNHSRALSALGRLDEAESSCRAVLDLQTELLGADHPHTLIAAHSLGVILIERGERAAAVTILRRVLEARVRVLGEEHPHTNDTRSILRGAASGRD